MKSEAITLDVSSSSETNIATRIKAATLASALSTIVVTPFDVCKTRMQVGLHSQGQSERQLCHGR